MYQRADNYESFKIKPMVFAEFSEKFQLMHSFFKNQVKCILFHWVINFSIFGAQIIESWLVEIFVVNDHSSEKLINRIDDSPKVISSN